MTEQRGKVSDVGQRSILYPWAYIDCAKKQLSLLSQGMRMGEIRPNATDSSHMKVALDQLDIETALVRQMLADIEWQYTLDFDR